jgi:hypothetical protein
MSMACFEVSFESPYKAIPYYLLWGMAMAPGLQRQGAAGHHGGAGAAPAAVIAAGGPEGISSRRPVSSA